MLMVATYLVSSTTSFIRSDAAIADDPVGSGLYRLRTEVGMEVIEDV